MHACLLSLTVTRLLTKQIVRQTEIIALISVHFIYIISNPLETYLLSLIAYKADIFMLKSTVNPYFKSL